MASGVEVFGPALPWAYFGYDELEQFSASDAANQTYEYDNITEFRHEWANTIDAQVAIGADIIDQQLDNCTFFKPIKAITEAGVLTAYVTGKMAIDEITGKVTVVTDGVTIANSYIKDTVGSALNAFGLEIAGTNKDEILTRIGIQVASKLLDRIVTEDELGSIFVLNKLVYQDDELKSYLDMQTLQAIYDALASAGVIPHTETLDYDVDEAVAKSDIGVPMFTGSICVDNAIAGFRANAVPTSVTVSDDIIDLMAHISLLSNALKAYVDDDTYPYYMVYIGAYYDGYSAHNISGQICRWTENSLPPYWKYINKLISKDGTYFFGGQLAFSTQTPPSDWMNTTSYSSADRYSFELRKRDGNYVVDGGTNTSWNLYSGVYETVEQVGSFYHGKSICGNLFGQEIDDPNVQKQEDIYMPPLADIPIDDLWPDWMERALDGSRYNAEDDVIVKAPALPIDIAGDKDEVITRDWDDVRRGILDPALALAGAYAGILSLTDIYDLLNRVKAMDGTDAIDITADPTPTPTPVIPGIPTLAGNAKLYTVHQMNSGQLDALGSYMWSSDFISLIEHMFSDPAQAVIGLHTLYYGGSLPIGSAEQIKLGSIPATGVTGQPVTNRYMSFSCGSVSVPNYYGNVEDYDPYTKVQIWLPFIGFRDLATNEVMGGTITVTYGIDIYTGACVANITIARDGVTQALYSFDGNCALTEPMTGADYSRVISGIISLGVGIATGVASGGVGAAIGAGALLANNKISYSRSGALSANAGAMCIKTPYILIRRPRAYDANFYEQFYGNPANNTVYLSQCSGYTRVKDIHVDSIACTDDERQEIERLLKLGVIM